MLLTLFILACVVSAVSTLKDIYIMFLVHMKNYIRKVFMFTVHLNFESYSIVVKSKTTKLLHNKLHIIPLTLRPVS